MGISSYFKNGIEYFIFQSKYTKNEDSLNNKNSCLIYLGRAISTKENFYFNMRDSLFKFDVNTLQKITFKSILKDIEILDFEQAVNVWNKFKDRLIEHKKINSEKDIFTEYETDEIIKKIERYRGSLISEKLNFYVISFGATFFLDQLISGIEYGVNVIDQIALSCSISSNIIKALIIYRLGYDEPYNKIQMLHEKDISSFLFQNINLSSQRISEYLTDLGSPSLRLNFHYYHINF